MYTNDNGYKLEPHMRRHYHTLSHSADLEAGRKPTCPPDDPADAQIGGTLRHVMSSVWASGRSCNYIDVGAHYGVTSMHMAAYIKARGMDCGVFAFECGKAADLAYKNTALNRLDDIITFERKAVAHTTIPQLFSYKQTELEGGSLGFHEELDSGASHVVDAVTLDEYFSGCDRQLLAKIDVEGGEHLVLAGAKQIMASDPHPVVALEYNPPLIRRGGADPTTMLDAYADNFSFFVFEHDPIRVSTTISPTADTVYEVDPDAMGALAAYLTDTSRYWADIMLLPKVAAFHDGTKTRLENASNYADSPL